MKKCITLAVLLVASTTALADTAKEIEASNQRRHDFCMERKLGSDWWKFASVTFRDGKADPTPEQVTNRKKFNVAEKACSQNQ